MINKYTVLLMFAFLYILESAKAQQKRYYPTSEFKTVYPSHAFSMNELSLKKELSSDESQDFYLPLPSGNQIKLKIEESSIIHPDLQAKYPEIKSYKVYADGVYGRVGFTYLGFNGMLFTPEGTVYIDKRKKLDGETVYVSYYTHDYKKHKTSSHFHTCLNHDESNRNNVINQTSKSRRNVKKASGSEKRTYRLALACTGEYGQFHGGNVPSVLSAMVVSMNRVNAIYERDFSITMQLIGNNDQLIFLNPFTDPYTNSSGSQMLGENQQELSTIIGGENYDIGHVFSTGGGGIASLGSVCSSTRKAQGVTGQGAPVGDPFDVDYVAHEMGHQFGGRHTQNNSCNRSSSAAYEPGSATTIMGYAGICPPNTQGNSDDYFHSHSYDEIIEFAYNGLGTTCAAITNTGNSAPVVKVPAGGFSIPKETPFVLKGSAMDSDGDNLSYCWEQMDLGPSSHPNSPIGNAPIFRSWRPENHGSRTFPRLSDVIIGNTVLGETYPTYTRGLTFRLTVRDQNNNGGGVDYEELSFNVNEDAGPFEVTSPGAGQALEAGNIGTVTWDIANTDQAPVNCQKVDIYVSNDFGLTYFDTIGRDLPNIGSADVIMPNITGNNFRIRVQAVDNIFFNLGKGSFSLTSSTPLESELINLSGSADFSVSVMTLNWNDPFSNENFFIIEKSIGGNSNFTVLDTVPPNTTTYSDSNILSSQFAYYKVYAVNGAGDSQKSNEVNFEPLSIASLNIANDLKLYPNPTHDLLFLSFKKTLELNLYVMIVDRKGSVLRKVSLVRGQKNKQFDLSDFTSGMYWMILTNQKEEELGNLSFSVVK